jgi:RHS repeat-associated protein
MLTDKYGQVAERYQYDVWGKAYDGRFKDGFPGWSGRNDNVYGFTGQRYQPELGVYSFAYRDYSSRTMRWLTEDPVKDGLNWYRYCYSNPIKYRDPNGESAVEAIQQGGKALGPIWGIALQYLGK